ncbi:hypothetical protein KC367_g110 [Hortaea werneckii]|nr:hypothetical protein KC367_g110 [Hortaea werneckii]
MDRVARRDTRTTILQGADGTAVRAGGLHGRVVDQVAVAAAAVALERMQQTQPVARLVHGRLAEVVARQGTPRHGSGVDVAPVHVVEFHGGPRLHGGGEGAGPQRAAGELRVEVQVQRLVGAGAEGPFGVVHGAAVADGPGRVLRERRVDQPERDAVLVVGLVQGADLAVGHLLRVRRRIVRPRDDVDVHGDLECCGHSGPVHQGLGGARSHRAALVLEVQVFDRSHEVLGSGAGSNVALESLGGPVRSRVSEVLRRLVTAPCTGKCLSPRAVASVKEATAARAEISTLLIVRNVYGCLRSRASRAGTCSCLGEILQVWNTELEEYVQKARSSTAAPTQGLVNVSKIGFEYPVTEQTKSSRIDSSSDRQGSGPTRSRKHERAFPSGVHKESWTLDFEGLVKCTYNTCNPRASRSRGAAGSSCRARLVGIPAEIRMVAEFPALFRLRSATRDLSLCYGCVTVNMAPSRMQSPPTTMYAMPRNGFLPPMTVWVDRSSDLVPSYGNTGKSTTKKRGISSLSLRRASLLKVGRPAVRIHTWKLSSTWRFGSGYVSLYVGYTWRQLGGGMTSLTVYGAGYPYRSASLAHAVPLLVMLYVWFWAPLFGFSQTDRKGNRPSRHPHRSTQLLLVKRLHVSSVVLVKVRQLVVQQDWRVQGIR